MPNLSQWQCCSWEIPHHLTQRSTSLPSLKVRGHATTQSICPCPLISPPLCPGGHATSQSICPCPLVISGIWQHVAASDYSRHQIPRAWGALHHVALTLSLSLSIVLVLLDDTKIMEAVKSLSIHNTIEKSCLAFISSLSSSRNILLSHYSWHICSILQISISLLFLY